MDPEPVPSYLQCFTAIFSAAKGFITQEQDISITNFWASLKQYCSISQKDVILVFGLAVLLTCLRFLLSKFLFTPTGRYFKLKELNVHKFPESAWKLLYYSVAWSLCSYVLFFCPQHDYFHRPTHIWEDWEPHVVLDIEVYAVYMLQLAFYVHSVYASFFMDHWRKDTIVMIFHHLLTIALISFSFATRYHKIGLLVLFLHDIADICLEFTKCNVYFKDRNKKFYAIHDHLSVVGFTLFASVWFVFRLYWFPLKALYSACFRLATAGSAPYAKFDFILNSLLWILQVLNVYWFMFILNFLYKVATGQMKEVDDVREEEVLEKINAKDEKPRLNGTGKHTNGGGSLPNGLVKRHVPGSNGDNKDEP